MPDISKLLEARAALDKQLTRSSKKAEAIPAAPPGTPSPDDAAPTRVARDQSLARRIEILLWSGAAAGVAGLALVANGPSTPTSPHPTKAILASSTSVGTISELTREARLALATRLKLASSAPASGVEPLRLEGWTSLAGSSQGERDDAVALPKGNRLPAHSSDALVRMASADVSSPDPEPAETGTVEDDDPRAASPGVLGNVHSWFVALAGQTGTGLRGYLDSAGVGLHQISDAAGSGGWRTAMLSQDPPATQGDVVADAPAPCQLTLDADPSVSTAAVATVRLRSTCGEIPVVSVDYGGHSFDHRVVAGAVEVDLFAGRQALRIRDPRGGSIEWSPPIAVFKSVAKAVLIWSTPFDLDLKAREFSAQLGDNPGFLWANRRSSFQEAIGTGRGFMSTVDDGRNGPTHIEVYTFFETASSPRGEVAFGVETGPTEDTGRCASSRDERYETYLLVNGIRRGANRSSIGSIDCKVALRTEPPRSLRGFQARLATPF